jgi:glycosyltransferase involved in cell wall biosynthesis
MTRQQIELLDSPEITPAEHQAWIIGETFPALAGMDPLRVLLVTPRYFPYMGGVENHVYQVAQRLARAGVDVTVLTTDPGGQLPTNEQSGGVKIRRVRAWPAKRDYYFAPDICRVITCGSWDIVHIQSYHTLVAPLAMLAALRADIPYVVTFHGGGHSSWLRNALRGIQRVLLRPLLARAERLIAIARFEIAFFGKRLRLPQERFVYIPNGSDISTVVRPAPATTDGTLIASVGRLERYKGHHRIIAALPYILEQRPDVRLWIAGTGPYEPALRRMAKKLGVADRVEIRAIPAIDRERMAMELSKAALVTLLSEYETHPIAALEALALGCSVLVADTSGLSELAGQGFARAIPLASSAEQVAAAVLSLLRQPLAPPRLDLPTWDTCAGDLLALYLNIAQRTQCVS